MSPIPEFLRSGELSRLIPVVADGNREQRAASVLLSAIHSVDEFGSSVLRAVGAPVRKTSRIECYSEVVFKNTTTPVKFRPDGLIIVRTGKSSWSAILEAKIGASTIDTKQVEEYIGIARSVGVDAVITISNQFATRVDQHPVNIDGRKLHSIGLFHWSWSFVLTEAILFVKHRGLSDPDQAFILTEAIRYLNHDGSGISRFSRMPTAWKEICSAVQNRLPLPQTKDEASECVGAWNELVRSIALDMSLAVGRAVSIHLSRRHESNPTAWLSDSKTRLINSNELHAAFAIPDAAAHLSICADLATRTVASSMTLRAPADRARATSAIRWLVRQIENCSDRDMVIVADWPGRTKRTTAKLSELLENPNALLPFPKSPLPKSFEVRQITDLAGRFRGTRTFVEDVSNAVPRFYEEIGQHLRAWTPTPPAIRTEVTEGSMPQPEETDRKPDDAPLSSSREESGVERILGMFWRPGADMSGSPRGD